MPSTYIPTVRDCINTLRAIKQDFYTKSGNPHPEIAAEYAVADILHQYTTQPQYLEQLLGEEIDDALRAVAELE